MKTLAIVPARAGSKRLPGKNLRPLHGKPLICWTLEAALQAQRIDRVIVSTDSEEIAEVSRKSGADVPFMRPPELAEDTTTTQDVIEHAIGILAARGEHYDRIMLLQPTSPLRTAKHIEEALDLFERKRALSVISVSPAEHPPQWINRLGPEGEMNHFLEAVNRKRRSQDFAGYYQLNGAIYIADTDALLRHHSFYLDERCFGYVMSRRDGIDIDTEIDWYLAEALMGDIRDEST